MRVTPWSQYQSVDQETDPDLQLASEKNRLVRGCAPFVCFSSAAAGSENLSALKVGPTQNQEVLQEPLDFDEAKDQAQSVDSVDNDDNTRTIVSLKSSLKKTVNIAPVAGTVVASAIVDGNGRNTYKHESLCENDNGGTCQMERRKVQWTDTTRGELFEIREFEMSEDGSDDEFDHGNGKTCSCRIM